MIRSSFVALLLAAVPAVSSAAVYLNDNFDSHTPATALVGQGTWLQTGTVATNPIQVTAAGTGNAVTLGTGQDAYNTLSAAITPTGGNKVVYAANISVATATPAGDYFLHLTSTGTNYFARLFARSSDAGFQLGLVDVSGTGSTISYPAASTNVLNFNQSYKVAVVWNFVDGTVNDTFAVYVDPTSATEGDNTAYLNHTWTSATAEPTTLTLFNVRQGGSTSFPGLMIDDVVVTDTFSDVVPEPTMMGLVGLAALGLVSRRRD